MFQPKQMIITPQDHYYTATAAVTGDRFIIEEPHLFYHSSPLSSARSRSDLLIHNNNNNSSLRKIPQWYPRVRKFLACIPQEEADYAAKLPSPEAVRSLRDRLSLAQINARARANLGWDGLFIECSLHVAALDEGMSSSSTPSTSSSSESIFFELVFIAACQVALRSGHDREKVNQMMRCFLQYTHPGKVLVDKTLAHMRKGVMSGIKLINVLARYRGNRAFAIPYYGQSCMTLFEHCTEQCLEYVDVDLHRTADKFHTADCAGSSDLFIPKLVHLLIGGDESSHISYAEVCSYLDTEQYVDPEPEPVIPVSSLPPLFDLAISHYDMGDLLLPNDTI